MIAGIKENKVERMFNTNPAVPFLNLAIETPAKTIPKIPSKKPAMESGPHQKPTREMISVTIPMTSEAIAIFTPP